MCAHVRASACMYVHVRACVCAHMKTGTMSMTRAKRRFCKSSYVRFHRLEMFAESFNPPGPGRFSLLGQGWEHVLSYVLVVCTMLKASVSRYPPGSASGFAARETSDGDRGYSSGEADGAARTPSRAGRRAHHERLAEFGWKPHRDLLAQKSLSRASIYWHMRETQRGTVSSNSRFRTVLIQQYSADLSYQENKSCRQRRRHTAKRQDQFDVHSKRGPDDTFGAGGRVTR